MRCFCIGQGEWKGLGSVLIVVVVYLNEFVAAAPQTLPAGSIHHVSNMLNMH